MPDTNPIGSSSAARMHDAGRNLREFVPFWTGEAQGIAFVVDSLLVEYLEKHPGQIRSNGRQFDEQNASGDFA